jgi:hypothetical protein
MEKEIKSIANVTSGDVRSLIKLAEKMQFQAEVERYSFEGAKKVIPDIRHLRIKRAEVPGI